MKRVCTASFPTLSDSSPSSSPSAPHPLAVRAAKCARIENIEQSFVACSNNTHTTMLELQSTIATQTKLLEKQGEEIQSLKHAMNEIADTLLVMRRHAGIADAESANGESGPDSTQHTPKEQRVRMRVPAAPQRAARAALPRRLHRE